MYDRPGGYLSGGRWKRHYNDGQCVGSTWERPVPRIPDSILDSVIYLYESSEDAVEGVRTGGSGFLLGIASELTWRAERDERGMHQVYAVTNSHVIVDGFTTIRL